MARGSLAAFVAFALLVTGHGARALPPSQVPDPTGGGVFEDPCVLNPDLCVPDPPQPPTSICDRFPDLCVNEDPPVFEPPTQTFSSVFAGTARLKGSGFQTTKPYGLQMNLDEAALTFLAMDEQGTLYSGHVVPKGTRSGRLQLQLFLDDVSSQAFGLDVAGRAADASGRAAGSVLGQSSKITVKVNGDGSQSIKIKSQVLSSGLGELTFKANLVELHPQPN